ncbi:hypothetical protein ABPG72_010661 [Tetrahymena utriculariae]
MFTDRNLYGKSNQNLRNQNGSFGDLDSVAQLSSKKYLKTISSPQMLARKSNQQVSQHKISVKLEPLRLNHNQRYQNNTQNSLIDNSDYYLQQGVFTSKSQLSKIDLRSSQVIDEAVNNSQKNSTSRQIEGGLQNEVDVRNNSLQLNKKSMNVTPLRGIKYSEYSSKRFDETSKSIMQKPQNDESLLENPSYFKLFETNKRITIQNQRREEALNELISQIESFLNQQPNHKQKEATTISEALNHLMNTIENAQKNEMEVIYQSFYTFFNGYLLTQLNKAMREMHKQLRENLKLQMESEIYKNQTKLGSEELFLYKQKYDGAQADIRQLKKENIQLHHINDEIRKKNQIYEKRLELLSDFNPEKKITMESNLNESFNNQDKNQSFENSNKKSSQEEIKSMSKIQHEKGEKNNQSKAPPALYKNGQMQIVLAELVKENENYKKQLKIKDQEIERLKELNYKQQDKMNRLYKKIDMIKMKRTNKEEDNKNSINHNDEDKFNFEKNDLPVSTDFKVQNISLRQQNFLSDLQEQGKESYLNQFEDDKKDQVELIISQLSSFREFSEKVNSMIHEIMYLINFTSINDIMVYLSRNIKQNFQAENVHLWVREAETGILRTYNQQGKELRALTTKGVFQKCIDQQKIINYSSSKEVTLYQNTDGHLVFQDKCVVFPIYLQSSQNNPQHQYLIGIFEVSKLYSDRMELDEQYLSIFLTKFLRFIFKKLHEWNVVTNQLRYQLFIYLKITQQVIIIHFRSSTMNQEFFQELCTSKSKFQFSQIIKKWASFILQSNAAQFVFVEDEQITLYQSNVQKIQVSSKISLASIIIQNKKSMIFYDSNKQVEYQKDIDVKSILPIYYHPIIIEDETQKLSTDNDNKFDETKSKKVVGVVQFVIKSRKQIASSQISEIIIVDQGLLSYDIDYKCFCQYIQSAYELLFINKNN